jgi:hypothetical protein
MLFSKPCRSIVFFASLLSANAETFRGVQQRQLDADATTEVILGTAGNYAILAKTGISTVPTSLITGDIAVSPIAATAMTGFNLFLDPVDGKFSTSTQFTGEAYAASYKEPTPVHLTTAVSDMEIAYTDASGRTNPDAARINLGSGEIGGLTLSQNENYNGVYTFGTGVTISLDVTFSGGPNDIFIIQMTGNLMVAAGKKVILAGGVQAKNIFWQVEGNARVHANAHMEGIILIKTDILFMTGSSLYGRVLAQTACDLQMATITDPDAISTAPSASPIAA